MEILGAIVVVILSTIFEGFTFVTLWGWFIASTFHVATLTIAQGLGIAMTVRFITNQQNLKKEQDLSFGQAILTTFVSCGLILLIGLIITLFI
jgi:hypothetical protein